MAKSTPSTKKQTFTIKAPNATRVQLAGCFTKWQERPVDLKKKKDGTWQASVTLEPGVYQYRFLVDGHWQSDPGCPIQKPNPFGSVNSIREVK